MKKTNLILTLLLAATMTACREVPEDVKSRHEANNSVNVDADKLRENYKTSTLTEMRSALPEKIAEIKALKLDNMTFSDYLTVDIPERMKTGRFISPNDLDKKHTELFRHYDSEFDEERVFINDKYIPITNDYANPDKGLHIAAGSQGYFMYSKEFEHFGEYLNDAEFIKSYTVAEAKNTKDAYKLINSDREIPVSDAIDMAQAFADDYTAAYGFPNKLIVTAIFLKECDEGYLYFVRYTASLSGVNTLEWVSHIDGLEEGITFKASAHAFITDEDVTTFWTNSAYKEHEITGELDSAVDVVDAAKYVSGTLSRYLDLEVKRIALEYCLIDDGNLNGEDYAPENAGELDIVKVIPCYVFYINETPGEEKLVRLRCDDMSVIYIDCKIDIPAG